MDYEVVFLGVCERANYVQNLHTWNIIGLKSIISSYIFPFSFDGLFLGFAFQIGAFSERLNLRLVDEFGNQIIGLNLGVESLSMNSGEVVDEPSTMHFGSSRLVFQDGWNTEFLAIRDSGCLITSPGTFYFEVLRGDSYVRAGVLHFVLIPPPSLSPDRVVAIKSNPNAVKAVRLEFGCKQCTSKSRGYASLERNYQMESQGWTWYKELPNFLDAIVEVLMLI